MTASLYSADGVELPTRTTPHNQVIVADVAPPTGAVMDNYLAIKEERQCTWDDIAVQVADQDPLTAAYLRENGPKHEKAKAADPGIAPVLTERAVNPLIGKEERDAYAKGAPLGAPIVKDETNPASTNPPKPSTAKA